MVEVGSVCGGRQCMVEVRAVQCGEGRSSTVWWRVRSCTLWWRTVGCRTVYGGGKQYMVEVGTRGGGKQCMVEVSSVWWR